MSTWYIGEVMTTHMIVGNPLVTCTTVRKAFKLMRMLVYFCLMLADVVQRDDEIIDMSCCVLCADPP